MVISVILCNFAGIMSWQFLITAFLLALLPGPDILFLLTQSVSWGVRAAWTVALGLCSGLIFHTAAVAGGVALIIAESPSLLIGLKYGGAAYLTYLGVKAVVSAHGRKNEVKEDKEVAEGRPSSLSFYRQGITMNLLNPKVALFFLAFLPGFVPEHVESQALYILMLGGVMIGSTFFVFSAVSVLGGWLGRTLQIGRYVQTPLFAYIVAGIYLAIATMIVL